MWYVLHECVYVTMSEYTQTRGVMCTYSVIHCTGMIPKGTSLHGTRQIIVVWTGLIGIGDYV